MNHLSQQGKNANGSLGRHLGKQNTYKPRLLYPLYVAYTDSLNLYLFTSTHRYFTFGAATAILALGLPARPDSSLVRWADRQAAERAESA